jgi:hypothetical protein
MWVLTMDLETLNVIVSLLSAAMMLVAIVYIFAYILGSFSSRSGAQSLRVVLFSIAYFFGTTVPIFLGVEWFTQLARERMVSGQAFFLNIGASALALSGLLHVLCGFLTIFLYVRGQMSSGLTIRQALNNIRARFRSKSKH